jgi:hypothetical protein
MTSRSASSSVIEAAPDLHPDLPVGDPAVLDVAPTFENLDPAEVLLSGCHSGDGVVAASMLV